MKTFRQLNIGDPVYKLSGEKLKKYTFSALIKWDYSSDIYVNDIERQYPLSFGINTGDLDKSIIRIGSSFLCTNIYDVIREIAKKI